MRRLPGLLALLIASAGAQAQAPPPSPEFSLATFNLYHDKDHWPRRREQILSTLRELQPDAIALQEVLQDEHLPNQAAWLARELGYHLHFITSDPPSRARRYGNALLTLQAPLERAETLLHPLEDHRVAGMVKVRFNDQPLNLYVTHLHWTPGGGAMRARQLQDLLAWIEATDDGASSLLAGDFNAEAQAPELGALRPRFVDAWARVHPHSDTRHSSTLNPHYYPNPARIDHVFVAGGQLEPSQARLLFENAADDGTWASDHRALLVKFKPTQAMLPADPADTRTP